MLLAHLAAIGCAVAFGLATVLESIGARRAAAEVPRAGASAVARAAIQGPYLLGLGTDGIGWVLSLVALASLPVFVVQSMVAGAIGFTVLFAAVLQHVRPTARQLGFILAIAVGLVGLALSGAPEEARRTPGAYAWAMVLSLVAVALLGWFVAARTHGSTSASLLGALAGLSFGGTALCGRAILGDFGTGDLRDPVLYALALFGVLGMILLTVALQRGQVTVVTAWMFVTETIVPSIVGLAVLGDSARNGMMGVAIASFAVTIVAAVGLSLVSPDVE